MREHKEAKNDPDSSNLYHQTNNKSVTTEAGGGQTVVFNLDGFAFNKNKSIAEVVSSVWPPP